MLVLGIIVILGMGLHLYNFWYNMMYAELVGVHGPIAPTDGTAFIAQTFACPVYTVTMASGAPCRRWAGAATSGCAAGE